MTSSRSTKVLILSSGRALTALVGIASAAILARVFSQHDYATYRQTLLAYTFAVPFVTLGFDRALYYFLPGEERRSRGILVENLVWLLGAGALLSLFMVLGGNQLLASRFNNPALAKLIMLLVPYPLLMLPAASLAACLMARDRTGQVAGFTIGSRVVMLCAIVVPCLIWPSPSTALIGTVLGAAVTTAAALILMFRACSIGNWRPTWPGLRRQIQFSLPLGLSGLAGTTTQSLGQVIVAALAPAATFAVFVNGAMEVPLVGMITGSITAVILVDYARLYREGRTDEIVALIHRVMVKSSLFLFPTMVFLLLMAPELMTLLFGQRYEASSVPFRIFLLMLPARTLTFGAVLQATGHSRHVLYQSILSLVSVGMLTWGAIRLFGPLLAPVGAVVSLYVFALPYLIVVLRRILACPVTTLFPWATLAKVAGASIVGAPAVWLLKGVGAGWPSFAVLFAAGGVYVLITAVVFHAFAWVPSVSWRGWRSIPPFR